MQFCDGGQVLSNIVLLSGPCCCVLRYIDTDVSEGLLSLILGKKFKASGRRSEGQTLGQIVEKLKLSGGQKFSTIFILT